MRDGLQVRMQDGTLCIDGLSMTIRAFGFRIEAASDFILGFGRDVALVLEDKNLIGEESLMDDIKVGI